MPRETPDRIGRYEILQELGRGSMGRVLLARDPNIDRRIAVKILTPLRGVSTEEEDELRRRFILEARAAGKVNHPGIVTVYDAETDPDSGSAFIAMEWVDGQSLEEILRESPLPGDVVARLGEQLALALDAAHRAELVHRDIKPANILLDRTGRAKISDFGIAKFVSMSNTAAGRLIGSPFYMSPEQVRDDPVDGRSDLFSLGTVLYQAMTGVVPFASDSLAGITYKILEIDPAPADSLNPEITPELAAVVGRALEKDPRARYQSGADFAHALRTLDAGAPAAIEEHPARPEGISPTGTLILPKEELAAAPATLPETVEERSRPLWLVRHRGPILAGLTLLAIPILLLVVAPRPPEPLPDLPAAAAEPRQARVAIPDVAPAVPETSQPAEELRPSPVERAVPTRPRSVPDTSPPARSREAPSRAETRIEQPLPPAVVQVHYRNHLRSGRMMIRVDDILVWSGEIGDDRGFLGRTVGNSIEPRITVPAGKHVIGVTIEGSDGTVGATKRIWGVFAAGKRFALRVRLVPPHVLRLSWDD